MATLPPEGRADSAEGRAGWGARAWNGRGKGGRPGQPQGPRADGSLGVDPAAETPPAGFDGEPYARAPHAARGFAPSRPSPPGGGSIAALVRSSRPPDRLRLVGIVPPGAGRARGVFRLGLGPREHVPI